MWHESVIDKRVPLPIIVTVIHASIDVSDAQSAVYYNTTQQGNSKLIMGTSAPVCRFTITIQQDGTGKFSGQSFFRFSSPSWQNEPPQGDFFAQVAL